MNQTISTAKNDAVASSGAYTDEQIKQNNSVINQTISTAKNDAVAVSKNFTEFKYSQSIDYAKNAALTSEKNANAYTDEKFRQMDKNVNSKFRGLNNKIEQAEKRLNAGLAGVAALASIPYINDSHFSYGIGLGNYQNGNALAAGVQLKIADNASIRLNTSWDSSNNSAIGIGIAGGL
ncbi:hypothetical protein A3466_17805 [Enterobacter genomosp. S]|uniref:Trimeric autotransporter adhesin YadA-like C-terminal membrane anchor domain-containing protein n=1 Tax=Enterobacter genomosp. S TaxID=2364151 RepID=A0ABR5YSL1_9ENTR|nr:hypothetical protein A3466_17805 [Enterobacter genomosp. S]